MAENAALSSFAGSRSFAARWDTTTHCTSAARMPPGLSSNTTACGSSLRFLPSRSNQQLHRVPGLGQPQPNTPPLWIFAVSLRTSLYAVWRRRCLQVSALTTTACEVDICFWSQNIIAATSVRSLGKLLRKNKLPPCKG